MHAAKSGIPNILCALTATKRLVPSLTLKLVANPIGMIYVVLCVSRGIGGHVCMYGCMCVCVHDDGDDHSLAAS